MELLITSEHLFQHIVKQELKKEELFLIKKELSMNQVTVNFLEELATMVYLLMILI